MKAMKARGELSVIARDAVIKKRRPLKRLCWAVRRCAIHVAMRRDERVCSAAGRRPWPRALFLRRNGTYTRRCFASVQAWLRCVRACTQGQRYAYKRWQTNLEGIVHSLSCKTGGDHRSQHATVCAWCERPIPEQDKVGLTRAPGCGAREEPSCGPRVARP